MRRVDAKGIITTVAGNPSLDRGDGGDGGPATSAEFRAPVDVAVDHKGNVFVLDMYNSNVRKINPAGIISTVAGVYSSRNVDYKGDGGPATHARFAAPEGIAVDRGGNLYIADTWNGVVRMVDARGVISTLTPVLDPLPGKGPIGVAVNNIGKVFVAYNQRSVIEEIDMNH